ncbi:MAG: hypothetical protein RXR06_11290 [Thermoproteus sp.]
MQVLEFNLNEYVNRSGGIKDRLLVLSGGGDVYGLTFYNVLEEKLSAVLHVYHRTALLHRPANLLFCGTSKLQRPKESLSDLGSLGDLRIDREMAKSAGEALNRLRRRPMAAGANGSDPYQRIMKALYEQYITIKSADYASVDFSVISVDERRSVSSRLDLGFLSSFLLL